MFLKKGAIDWTIGKLISLILMVFVVVLIIYGFTSGGINPLVEKIGWKFDEVKSLLNLKDDFGGDPGDCRTLDLTDFQVRGGVEFLEAMSFLNGRSEDGYRLDLFGEDDFKSLDICRGQTNCVLNASVGGNMFSWGYYYNSGEVWANQFSTWYRDYDSAFSTVFRRSYQDYAFLRGSKSIIEPYKFNEKLEDAKFYWELRNKSIGLSNNLALDNFDEMYGDLDVFYSYAYDGKNPKGPFGFEIIAGQQIQNEKIEEFDDFDDELMFSVGWMDKWDIYFYPKGNGNYLYPKLLASGKSTAEMLEFFKRETNDFSDFYDDYLYYKTINMEEYREILSWKSGKFLGTGASNNVPVTKFFKKESSNYILNRYPPYDSEKEGKFVFLDEKDSHLDDPEDIKDLIKFIDEKNEDSQRDFQEGIGDIQVVIDYGGETRKYMVDPGATLESEGLKFFVEEEFGREYYFKIKGTDETGDYFIRYRFNEWEFSQDNFEWSQIKNQNILGVTLSSWLEIIKNLDSKNYIDGVNSIFNECVDGSNSCELQSDREGGNYFQMKTVADEGDYFIRYVSNNWHYSMGNSGWYETEGSGNPAITYPWLQIIRTLNDWDYNGGVDSIIEECLSMCGGSVVGDESPFGLLNNGDKLLDEKWDVKEKIFTVISSGTKFQNMLLLKGQSIEVLGDQYIVKDISLYGDLPPTILLDGPRGEFYMQLAWPLRGEINFRIFKKDGTGLVPVGDADDYMLPEGEFLDGYMVTGIYELMDRNC